MSSSSAASGATPRQRMLAAYRGQRLDRVPVAPEFWCYLPARVLGVNMIELERIPHWQALHKTFKHYRCDGWGIVGPREKAEPDFDIRSETKKLDAVRLEHRWRLKLAGRELTWASIADPDEPGWTTERMVKDLDHDWPIYEQMTLRLPPDWDWTPAQQALNEVGEDYLLELFAGVLFLDYVAAQRSGGIAQAVLEVMEREAFFLEVRERYIERMRRMIREGLERTTAASVFLGSGWSCVSLVGPRLFRQWEYPVIESAARAAHEAGGLLHVHLHGRCMEIVPDLPDLGVDCVCPFERPPGGDVVDLPKLRELLADRVTMNGNVHTVETLIRGGPEEVRREVLEILQAFRGSARLIVGTGDQVGKETPDENIYAMIQTAQRFGRFE